MKSILDPKFKYIPSSHTNIRKTFERIKREQAKVEKAKTDTPPPPPPAVSIFRRKP